MKRLFFLIVSLFFFSAFTEAQYSRYIISFRNKNGGPFSISNPSQFLSAKSLARRNRQNILVDSTDLPVTPAYLDSLRLIPNIQILNKSNWLNQVSISTTDPAALVKINAFSFVKASSPVALRSTARGSHFPSQPEAGLVTTGRIKDDNSVTANVYNYGNALNQVHLHNGEYLHNQGFTGGGITIAILDAGFFGYKTNTMFDSVRLQNNVLGEWDFVAGEQSVNEDNSHGMFCFSTMAANKPGSMVGTAPRAQFYLYRTEDVNSEYPVEEQNWAAAAERADSVGADMISSSLGYADFDDPSFDHSYAQRDGNTSIITRAADLAAKKGLIVMNSAGNDGASTGDKRFVACPADGDSVTAVGAVDASGNIAVFSSWGPNSSGKRKPNIVSLGVGTTIAGTNGNPSTGNGTSFANPNVAGLVACFWQAFPEFNNMAIIDAVQKGSSRYNNPDDRFGYGIPDFKKAFALLIKASFKGTMNNDKCLTTFTWSGKDDNQMRYEVERKTGSDTGYTKIATLAGSSAAFAVNNYSFKDTLKFSSSQNVRYRLKQILPGDSSLVLIDSTITTTSSCSLSRGILVSPNPVTNLINLTINADQPIRKLTIGLYNSLGQRLYYFEGAVSTGMFTHAIPAAMLPGGIYIVTVRDGGKIIFSEKVLK